MKLLFVFTVVNLAEPLIIILALLGGYFNPVWWRVLAVSLGVTVVHLLFRELIRMPSQFPMVGVLSTFIAALIWTSLGLAFKRWRASRAAAKA